jgi:carbamoyl-phosphate synthase large subunit
VKEDAIERGEDRQAFKNTMNQLGIEMPRSEIALSLEEAESILQRIDLPCVIRPAYNLGGTGGGLVYNLEEFRVVVSRGLSASLVGQVLIQNPVHDHNGCSKSRGKRHSSLSAQGSRCILAAALPRGNKIN